MKFFSTDSGLFKFLARLWDVILLDILWTVIGLLPLVAGIFLAGILKIHPAFYALCGISLVTFGPATVSAFQILLHMVEDTEGYIVKPFFRGIRSNMRQGVPLGIIFLVIVFAIYTDFYVLSGQLGMVMFFIAGVFTTAIGVVALVYAFPLTARYENSLFNNLRNSMRISMRYFLRSLLMWLALAAELVIFLWNTYTQIVGLLIGPMVMMLTVSGFAIRIFHDIEKDGGVETKKTEEDLYNEEIEREVEAAWQKEQSQHRKNH